MEPKSLQAGPDYAEGLINKMRTVIRRSPHQGDAGHSTPRSASLGHRLRHALTGGPSRSFSGSHSSPDRAASPSFFVNNRPTFLIIGLLMALAVSLLFLLSGGLIQAQEADDAIEYAEKRTDAVAKYTAVDPEGRKVYWSLLSALPSPVPQVDGEPLEDTDFQDNGDFSISADGVLTFNIPPDHESPDDTDDNNEYNIVVVASDGAPGSDPIQMGYKKVVVKVTDEDELGVITLSSLQPQVGAQLMASLSDVEVTPNPPQAGNDLAWKWERSRSRSSGWEAIHGEVTASLSPGEDDVGHYLRVTATYDVASDDDTERTAQAVSLNKTRAAPLTADAIAVFPDTPSGANDRSVDENSPAGTAVGEPVAAIDTVDDVLTYSLTGEGGFRIDPATGQITVGSRTVLDADDTGTDEYSVTVTATEASGRSVGQGVTITVNDVNEAPMMTVGVTTQMHAEDDEDDATDDAEVLTVGEYRATDPDVGTTLTWSVEGADKDRFEISSSGDLTFEVAPNYEMPEDAGRNNVYNVTVVVTDDGVDADDENEMTAMREVVITVTNVEEDGTVELSAQQPKAGVELTASVTDLDGGVTGKEWQWYDDTINESDLTQNAIAGATSDTYTPKDGDVGKTLSARVTYTDNKGAHSAVGTAAHLVLARGDHEPKFDDDEDGKRTIAENSLEDIAVGLPVTATDGDTDDVLTYTLSGRDAASFTVGQDDRLTNNNEGGQIKVGADTELDHETKPIYMVTVKATDPGGLSDSIDVTITVMDVDEAPEVTGDAEIEVEEDWTRDLQTYRAVDPEGRKVYWSLLSALPSPVPQVDGEPLEDTDFQDNGDFSISADGVLTFNIPPDHESPDDTDDNNEYNIVVVASDGPLGDNPVRMGYKKVEVTVTDEDERGVITLSSLQPQVGAILTATLADQEAPNADNVTWEWERSRSRTSGFAPATGSGAANATYTPVPDDVNHYLRVTATYDVAVDDNTERTAQEVSVNRGRAVPVTTTAATFPDGPGERSVDENSPAGTKVGDPVTATDTVDDVLTYSLTGEGGFRIDPATGQITVGSRTVLDADDTGTDEYSVTVTATEASGRSVGQGVTITVNDVNEAPMMTVGVTTQMHAEDDEDDATDDAEVLTVGEYRATDPDVGTTLTWSVEGADKDRFEISSSGDLTFEVAPNYEMPEDAGRNNVYNVTVVVTDDGVDADDENEMTAMREVVITVTNVEEDGTVELSAQQPKAGVELTASVTDLDGGVTGKEWQWYDDTINESDLTQNAIAGATSDTYTPKDGDVGKTLSARVTYTDNKGAHSAVGTAAHLVLARGDHEPKFDDDEDGKRTIAENSLEDIAVGLPVTATDGDTDDVLTYTLSGRDAASFTVGQDDRLTNNNEGGQIKVGADTELDHETKPIYMVTVKATDPGGLSDSIDVTITVMDVDEAPEISEGVANAAPEFASATAERVVAENTAAGENIGDPVAASDDDDDTLTYGLRGPYAGSFDIGTATGQLMTKAVLDYETKPRYMVTVTANDGEDTATIDVTIMVTDVNDAPEFASATAERVVAENTAAGENIGDPVAASDDDADTLTYVLGGPDAGSFDIGTATGQLMTKEALDYETKPSYMVTVTANDGEDTATIDVTITVIDVNEVPEFGATAARVVAENTAAGENIGDPVEATDDDADTLTYVLGGPDARSFDIGTATGQLMTKEALDYETKPSYMVTVTANDGEDTATINVTIMVTDVNEAPEFASATAEVMVAENTAAGENIGDPVAATDDDDDTLTYVLGGPDAGSFDIDTATGQLITKAVLDYETKPRYMVTVTANDGEDTATIDVTIMVTDVNDAPEFASATAERVVAENTAAGENIGDPVAASDDDADTLTYVLGGPDAGSFDIDTATGQLMTKAYLDYGTKSSYMVTVTANDGEDTATIDVTIMVTDVNEAPEFAGLSVALMVAENASAGENIGDPVTATDADADDTLTYGLRGPDAGSFDIDTATGQLMTKAALDYETKPSYMITVTATDGEDMDSIDVTIMVTDVNEAPEFAGATAERMVAESTAAGENIGDPVAATDADEPLTYALGGPDAGSFDIDTATGQLMTKADLDYETKSIYMVTVTATDGEDMDSIDVTITVIDVNEAPEFGATAQRVVAENTAAGENIGDPVEATDANDDTLTYGLRGPDAGSFDIGTATGQLMTKEVLDYETKPSYMVTVTATDGEDMDSIDVTIMVTDVNDAPEFASATAEVMVAENTAAGENIGDPVAATDDDDDTLTYVLGGPDAGSFDIDTATGQLMTKASLDYETKPSYMITVTANDGEDTATIDVTIMVTDVNDAPEFASATAEVMVAENTAAGENIGDPVAATDDDDTLTYVLGGPDAGSFDIDTATGQLMTKEALDYETKSSYMVTVTANDGVDTATIDVTITVTDVDDEAAGLPGDTNNDGRIDKSEVIAAYRAYVADPSDKSAIIAIYRQYVQDAASS